MRKQPIRFPAFFERFALYIAEADARTVIEEHARTAACPGDVQLVAALPYVREQLDDLDSADMRAELGEFGAWSPDELDEDEENRRRVLWIACSWIVEDLGALPSGPSKGVW
jgi:hypothetical protein